MLCSEWDGVKPDITILGGWLVNVCSLHPLSLMWASLWRGAVGGAPACTAVPAAMASQRIAAAIHNAASVLCYPSGKALSGGTMPVSAVLADNEVRWCCLHCISC